MLNLKNLKMKKLLCFLCGMLLTLSLSAQVATENTKFFDNMYIGITGGVNTPLSFNQMFPVNEVVGLKAGKEITPVYGVEIESIVSLNDHINGHHYGYINTLGSKTAFKGINTTVSGTINLTNAICGYDVRSFELKTNTGIGWAHIWGIGHGDNDELTSKTGLDFQFNSWDRTHSFIISPAVYWNLTNKGDAVHFNRTHAYLGINISYVYHFGVSHKNFIMHNIGDYNDRINKLRAEANKPARVITEYVNTPIINPYVITFAQGSDVLTNDAKNILNNIPSEVSVDVYGFASPEGSPEFNNDLSERRAINTAMYLRMRGVTVNSLKGYGAVSDESQRIVIIDVH